MNKILKLNTHEFEKIYEKSRSKIDGIINKLDKRINTIFFQKDHSLLFAGRFICNGYTVITERQPNEQENLETFNFNTDLLIQELDVEEAQNFEIICQNFIQINYSNYEEIISEVRRAQEQYEFYKNKV